MGLGRKLITLGAMAAGAVIGILFAPKKGSHVRKDLAKEWEKGGTGVNTLKDTATKMSEDIAQTSKDIYESETIQKGKESIKQTAKEAYEKAKGQAKNVGEKAKERVKDIYHGKSNEETEIIED